MSTQSNTPVGVVIVAGAGIAGIALSKELATKGVYVALLDSKVEPVTFTGDTSIDHALITWHTIDLLNVDQVLALQAKLLTDYTSVDALVHLVGGFASTPTLSPDSIKNWLDLSARLTTTLVTLTSIFGAAIKSAPRGRVIMVTASATKNPKVGTIAYASAKVAAATWMLGLSDYFKDTSAQAVTIEIKALLTDRQISANPDKDYSTFTHVDELAQVIANQILGSYSTNEKYIDLTATPTQNRKGLLL